MANSIACYLGGVILNLDAQRLQEAEVGCSERSVHLFRFSILYLFALFVSLTADALVRRLF